MKPPLLGLALAGLMSLSAGAIAHGNETHPKEGPVRKEQMTWGIAGEAKAAKRTIEFTMGDNMRFTPDKFEVRQGETVRLVIKNEGQLMHELVIGTRKTLDEHAAMMIKFPGMEHDEPYQAHVPPGKTGEIVWTFNQAGALEFACLIAGHYQAGMIGKIRVVPARTAKP